MRCNCSKQTGSPKQTGGWDPKLSGGNAPLGCATRQGSPLRRPIQFAASTFFVCIAIAGVIEAEEQQRRAKFNKVLNIGDPAPTWAKLIGVDDKTHDFDEYKSAKVVVIVFTCNHCPIAQAYEPRLIDLTRKYKEQGVEVVAVNVSLNRADGLDQMKERAQKQAFPFPYLFDSTQSIGRAYGATVTPHFFVLDARRQIAFMGAFDDQMVAKDVRRHYVADAVEALLAGKIPPARESLQRGCGIVYQ